MRNIQALAATSEQVQNMTMTTEVQWSELQRDARGVARLVDGAGEVRVRRRDGVPLLLSREDRIDETGVGLLAAARALRTALKHLPEAEAAEVLGEEFPWVDLLPAGERAEFVSDFVRSAQSAAELRSWGVLARTVTEWQATARIHADPELHAALSTPIGDDHGVVPNPGSA